MTELCSARGTGLRAVRESPDRDAGVEAGAGAPPVQRVLARWRPALAAAPAAEGEDQDAK